MKPLQSIAMGLLIVALVARADGYDLLPDPVGWLLVLQGLHLLPTDLPLTPSLRSLALVSLGMSVVLWFPGSVDGLADADESLLWAANLPQLAFVATLCLALARAAGAATDPGPSRWLRAAAGLTLAAALLPVVVLGADGGELLDVMVVGATVVLLLVIVLLFRYPSRPWALREVDQTACPGAARSG